MTSARSIRLSLVGLLFAATLWPAHSASAHPHETPSAESVVDALVVALGGQAAWDQARYLHFTFAGRRTHTWDRATGRHRVEGKDKEGKSFVVLSNLNSKQGDTYFDGQLVPADSPKHRELLELAYGTWVNDTYWLLMPYKLRDPGVQLAYEGRETIEGRTYDKLALSFEKVGLTPGDRYWVYVDAETHLVGRWAYLLEGSEGGQAPTAWTWEGWKSYGGIQLAPMRRMVGAERTLELSDLRVDRELPDAAFTSPAPIVWP